MITLEEVLRSGANLTHFDRTLIFNRGNRKFEIEFIIPSRFLLKEYRKKKTKQYETLSGAMTEFEMEQKFLTFEQLK